MPDVYDLVATLWQYQGQASWHFVTLPRDVSAEVRSEFGGMAGGFGSLRVEVTIGGTTFRTSIFPDSKQGAYLLPIKAAVRRAESLQVGDEVRFRLRIL